MRNNSSSPEPSEQRRLRSAISALLWAAAFLASVVGIFIALSLLLHTAGISLDTEGGEEGPKKLLNTLALCAIALGTTAGFARREGRSIFSFGLADRYGGRRLAWGVVSGIGLFAVLVAVLILADAIRFGAGGGGNLVSLEWGVFWLGCYLAVAAAEEILFRGYLLSTLASGFGWPVAMLVTSVLFGLAHLSNGSESALAAFNAILLGVVLAWSVRRSGSLWWAIGLHTGWDWAESYVAGAADSGVHAMGRFATAIPYGPALWSGGDAGPEGSVATLVPVFLAGIACAVTLRPARYDRTFATATP